MFLEIRDMKKGQMCVVQGNRKSGKSTFLNGIGGLDVLEDMKNEWQFR